jgi:hypothetical protein
MSNDTPKPAESGPLDLAEIEARLKAITPGQWHYWSPGEEERFRVDIEGRWIANKVWDEPDADFIANAPTDIAALIQEVKRLWAELAELKAEDELWWNSHHE